MGTCNRPPPGPKSAERGWMRAEENRFGQNAFSATISAGHASVIRTSRGSAIACIDLRRGWRTVLALQRIQRNPRLAHTGVHLPTIVSCPLRLRGKSSFSLHQLENIKWYIDAMDLDLSDRTELTILQTLRKRYADLSAWLVRANRPNDPARLFEPVRPETPARMYVPSRQPHPPRPV
jgi:hypothetical protein